jgi:diguanylate cyclase (GGDEF)-like protein/PAS domain S-box-containing protein
MANTDHSEPNPVRASKAHTLVCAAIMVLGATGAGGWILKSKMMVSFAPGMVPMVFDTGLCFLSAGIALWLTHRPGAKARWARGLLAVFLIVLCGTVLAELLTDTPLYVDFESLHGWYDYGNKRPGRMAPNTAVGFILIGAGILLADRVTTKNRGIGAVVLTFCVLAVGLTGLLGYALTPDLLFEWTRSARMAVHTSAGMILCSVALRLMWSKSRWYTSHEFFREDVKIRLLALATLVVMTITAAMSGFVLQQNALQILLASKLQSILQDRSALLAAAVQQGIQTPTADRLARLTDAASAALLDAGSSIHAASTINAEMLAAGLRGVALENTAGAVVERFGDAGAAPRLTAPLTAAGRTELVWDGGLILRARLPLLRDGKRIGALVMDQSAASLNKALFDTGSLGRTAEIAACVQRGAELSCFPGSRHTIPFTVRIAGGNASPLPMQLALAGQTGAVVAVDYRGQNVIAAIGLLAPGLGIVVKQDAVELYGVVRETLRFGIPLLAAIALLGAILLYLQLKPLTAKMLAAEARASEREAQMRTVIESVAEGILTFDAHGMIRDVNPAACEIFGYEARELVGQSTNILMPDEAHDATFGRLPQETPRGLGVLAGQRNVKLSGQRRDGSEFPLEMTINASTSSGKRSYVAIARDITERMEAERKLTVLGQYDSLTGLPNRSLFMDRLKSAAARMERYGAAFALMFLDVDGFKEINDTFGHRAGDDLLIQFAQRLIATVRDCDTVARLAGDEFTIILEGLSEPDSDSRRVADKIVASLAGPFVLSGCEVHVTASLGLVVQRNGGFDTAELLARADAAMYAAKRAGKNRVIAE